MKFEITFEHEQTTVKNVFGGKRVEVAYLMKHVKNGLTNRYRVLCDIGGIEARDPHLHVTSAEWLGDMETESNDETLTEQGAINLFEEYQ